ncbi:DUF2309 domain-containing protein [Alsobacter sp. SYSU M60028]|uniref:Probable inorganic carbon transporter subunit DabA n=1 Tax=Alsobacter ponti TaxID=2962936 RepID=A0ABT1LA94_9HYPH|nr:DUF2309 domain-containing protein [Alsobacter ponti]MCP8938407.1 DUF2309 domain-containing protein [Alsobacter ponti]
MLLKHAHIAPSLVSGLFRAAEAAARAIPPAFPLSATVAVNPFLGQAKEDLATASARLARTAGVRLARARADTAAALRDGAILDEDLWEALAACPHPAKPQSVSALKALLAAERPSPSALPTVAELAASATGTDWAGLIARAVGLWAAGHFDRGQALWSPAPGRGAFAAWRDWATHDLTPEIAGLSGFCAHVSDAPDTAERAILRAAERLGIAEAAAETAFHRLLMDLGGWAQHARWLLWQAELAGRSDETITDLLAIRLVFEEALLAHVPEIATDWKAVVAAHAEPVTPSSDNVADAILQTAAERAHQRRLADRLAGAAPAPGRPAMQAAFCIDVRSEVVRRSLESVDPSIETIGFAGFFGLPVAHRALGTVEPEAHLPALLRPSLFTCGEAEPEAERSARISARAWRAWGRFRQAAVSSFAFVESAGPAYGWKLVRDALGLAPGAARPQPRPRFDDGLSAEARAATASAVLKAMSLTGGFARLVLLVGHGARVANNPHASAYHCGACGGHTGEVSARLLARILNDPDTRALLPAHGLDIPADTLFVAGLHETTTDRIVLFVDDAAPSHAAEIDKARGWLERASALTRAERAARLSGATPGAIAARATNWAEIRPEWGLAGCASFIAGPRSLTAKADLQGRAFLHNYDWRGDAGFATLELILTAPVVVASWISLQYYGSAVAPEAFGGGNKLIHNVVGGIGVVQGNGGKLQPGLPWQTIHDGERLVHEPLRLSVLIEAPREAIIGILERNPSVRALFDNGWLHLLVLENGRIAGRYLPGLNWEGPLALPRAA